MNRSVDKVIREENNLPSTIDSKSILSEAFIEVFDELSEQTELLSQLSVRLGDLLSPELTISKNIESIDGKVDKQVSKARIIEQLDSINILLRKHNSTISYLLEKLVS